jgi:hypothetical protein
LFLQENLSKGLWYKPFSVVKLQTFFDVSARKYGKRFISTTFFRGFLVFWGGIAMRDVSRAGFLRTFHETSLLGGWLSRGCFFVGGSLVDIIPSRDIPYRVIWILFA